MGFFRVTSMARWRDVAVRRSFNVALIIIIIIMVIIIIIVIIISLI